MAILMTQYPQADNRMLRNALRVGASATQPGKDPWNPYTGFGMLQIENALKAAPNIKKHPYYRSFA